jgi:hypothetical protein
MEISKKTRGLRRACDAAAMLDLTPAVQTAGWPTAPKALARRGRAGLGDVASAASCHQPFSLFKSLSLPLDSACLPPPRRPCTTSRRGPRACQRPCCSKCRPSCSISKTRVRAAAPHFSLHNCTEFSQIPLAGVQAQVSWKCRIVPPSLSRLPTMPLTTFAISCALPSPCA